MVLLCLPVSQSRLLTWKIPECQEKSHTCLLQRCYLQLDPFLLSLTFEAEDSKKYVQPLGSISNLVQGPAHSWGLIEVNEAMGTLSRASELLVSLRCEVQLMMGMSTSRLPAGLSHKKALLQWDEGDSW